MMLRPQPSHGQMASSALFSADAPFPVDCGGGSTTRRASSTASQCGNWSDKGERRCEREPSQYRGAAGPSRLVMVARMLETIQTLHSAPWIASSLSFLALTNPSPNSFMTQ